MEASRIARNAEIDGVYRLTRVLGHGGMGAVWEAEHLRLPRHVAIKFLLGAFTNQPELVHRFRREAEIASRLRHPNIVEVYDFNTLSDGTPYLVMERLTGMSLRERLERGVLPLGEVREVLRQIVSALALAHRERVIHRDLKPENIFLCDDPDGAVRVKVLDFGISKADGTGTFATVEGSLLGTPAYMAPEQAMGKHSRIDGRTDLFALAAIAYEMLSGRIAFGGDTLIEVVHKVTSHMPEPLEQVVANVPSAVSTAVAQALSKDPEDRQGSVQEFFASFEAEIREAEAPVRYRTGGTSLRMAAQEVTTRDPDPTDLSMAETLAPSPSPVHAQGSFVHSNVGYPQASQAVSPERRGRGGLWIGLGLALFVGIAVGSALAFGVGRQESEEGAEKRTTDDALARANEDGVKRPNDAEERADEDGVKRPDDAEERANENGVKAPDEAEARADEDSVKGADEDAVEPAKTSAAELASAGTASTTSRTHAGVSVAETPELREARAALERGAFDDAVRLGRKSLRDEKNPEAYELLAKAHCGQRDLGMAQAMLRNLNRAAQSRVRDFCRKHGLTPG